MIIKTCPLLEAIQGKEVIRPPVWLMRQAGRYLPEYRQLRSQHTLSALFHDAELATKVTLFPLQRFALDAAIVFSDLLILAEVWGKQVIYPETGGPYITPSIQKLEDIPYVAEEEIGHTLSYVLHTIELLLSSLQVPLLGFCGAPFTLLCYLLEGKTGEGFSTIQAWIAQRPYEMHQLLDRICDAVIKYVRLQIRAGVAALQIFDSWASLLSRSEFALYALPYWKKIQDACAKMQVPIIFFSRANSRYVEDIIQIAPSVISFDEGKPLDVLRNSVPDKIAIQGNFSPSMLALSSKEEVKKQAYYMARSVQGKKSVIFNLGHGVLPYTPIENVEAFLEGISLV